MHNEAQVVIACSNLNTEMEFFITLGFKLRQIYPADNPRVLVISGFGLTLRMRKSHDKRTVKLQLPHNKVHKQTSLTSPNGVIVRFSQALKTAPVRPDHIELIVNKFDENTSWVTGRAGMLYRDLISNRLGGYIIASNILIPIGGPVPDHVHYHSIQFQLIFCVKGWVKVVYEDQGEPFILRAGDCVTQPPEIRHQVLESSDGLEVLEIGIPAEHMTTLDYEMLLPSTQKLPHRSYQGQEFCHHINEQASWQGWCGSGLQVCETAVLDKSVGIAAVNVYKPHHTKTQEAKSAIFEHQNVFRFYYIMAGRVKISNQQGVDMVLNTRDSFQLQAGQSLQLSDFSEDFCCIEFIVMD